jgi:hypothetical protein
MERVETATQKLQRCDPYIPPSVFLDYPRLLDSRLHDFRKSTQAGFDILLTAYGSCIAIRDTRCFLYFVSLIL